MKVYSVIVCLAVVCLSYTVACKRNQRDTDMANQSAVIAGKYIVKLKDGVNLEQVISTLNEKFENVEVTNRYTTVFNGFAAKLSDQAKTFLEDMDVVEYIEADQVISVGDPAQGPV